MARHLVHDIHDDAALEHGRQALPHFGPRGVWLRLSSGKLRCTHQKAQTIKSRSYPGVFTLSVPSATLRVASAMIGASGVVETEARRGRGGARATLLTEAARYCR